MQTPDIESSISKPPSGASAFRISHRPNWRSLILEKPVVATRSCSPIQTLRLLFAPAWPGPSCAGFSCRTSHILNFLSLDVVTIKDPSAFHDNDCTMSLCLSVSFDAPASTSHILIVKSPEAVASTFSAEGLNSTWPTFLECPVSLATGFTSATSSSSACRVSSSGTFHTNTCTLSATSRGENDNRTDLAIIRARAYYVIIKRMPGGDVSDFKMAFDDARTNLCRGRQPYGP